MNSKIKMLVLLVFCITMTSVVCAEQEHVDIDGDITMTFYSESSDVGQSGYISSIEYEGTTYYISSDFLEQQFSENDNDYPSITDIQSQINDMGEQSVSRDQSDFQAGIDYDTNQTVGEDTNANVITNIDQQNENEINF